MSTRKIKDAVDHGTKELIYFKGHAKATYMSDGSTVEDTINNIESKIDLSDYVTTDELEGYAKIEAIPSLEGYVKETDLPNFDEYATEQWVNNKNYATEYDLKNIDYSSINNVPVSEDETGELNITDESGNIGMKVASEAVYAKDFVAGEHKLSEKVDKTYVDNSIAELVDGAPETLDTLNELAAALHDNADIVDVLNQSIGNKQDTITDLETIRQGAAKGATALQSYTEQYKGTVTGVKINGTTKNPSSGVVDLGTVITAHQDISGKQDKLVSGTNIKTINGESILGEGDIEISGGSSDANVQAVDTGDVIDDVTVDYATKTYVDGLIGDINSILESIINGGGSNVSMFPIILTTGDNGQTAVDLYNYVVQNHEDGLYTFKENEIVKYNSEIIPQVYYEGGSIIVFYLNDGTHIMVNQSGMVMLDSGN